MEQTIINDGDFVACDFCNGGEDTMGGVLLGSYAICDNCARTLSNPEEVDFLFDPTKTFRENVLKYREETYGTSDAITVITTW